MSLMSLPPLAEIVTTTTTSPPPASALSLTGALSFNGQPVYVTTGNVLGPGGITLVFSLTNPVVVGDLKKLIVWAGSQFGVDITYEEIEDVVNKIPSQVSFLRNALESVLDAQLVLTILNVSIQPNVPTFVQVGATLTFNPPIGPTWFNLMQVGFTFTKGQGSTSP
jgi:hypothetical protein